MATPRSKMVGRPRRSGKRAELPRAQCSRRRDRRCRGSETLSHGRSSASATEGEDAASATSSAPSGSADETASALPPCRRRPAGGGGVTSQVRPAPSRSCVSVALRPWPRAAQVAAAPDRVSRDTGRAHGRGRLRPIRVQARRRARGRIFGVGQRRTGGAVVAGSSQLRSDVPRRPRGPSRRWLVTLSVALVDEGRRLGGSQTSSGRASSRGGTWQCRRGGSERAGLNLGVAQLPHHGGVTASAPHRRRNLATRRRGRGFLSCRA